MAAMCRASSGKSLFDGTTASFCPVLGIAWNSVDRRNDDISYQVRHYGLGRARPDRHGNRLRLARHFRQQWGYCCQHRGQRWV